MKTDEDLWLAFAMAASHDATAIYKSSGYRTPAVSMAKYADNMLEEYRARFPKPDSEE